MMKRLFLFVATLFSIGLASMDAQPFAYITAEPSKIVVLNLANGNVITTISTYDVSVYKVNGIAVTPDGTRAIVAAGSSALIINTATNKIIANLPLDTFYDDDREVAVSPDGKCAYITSPTPGRLWVINLEKNTPIMIITVGGKPKGIVVAPDGTRVYVAGCGSSASSLCVISTATNTVTATLGINSDQLVIAPDGTRLYIFSPHAGLYGLYPALMVLDTAKNVVTATIGTDLFYMAISPDGKYLYLTGLLSYTNIFDTSSNKIIATVNAGGLVAVNPDGKYVYLIDKFLDPPTVWVVDTKTNTISGKLDLDLSQLDYSVVYFKHIAITPGPILKPTFPAAGVVNAASYQGGGVAPGEIAAIFGSDIGPPALTTLRLTPSGLVDSLLADTRVLFDGVPAPLVFVSQNQDNVVVPYAVAGKSTTQVQVEYKGLKSDPVTLRVVSAAPGIFTLNSSGRGQGAVLNENLTVNSASNPALRGSIVVLYATGEGQTNPAGVDGKIASDILPKPLLPVSVQIGGVPAEVIYAGAAPSLVAGVLQINVRVPLDGYISFNPDNTVWVGFTVGNASSQQGVTIAVR